jgi:hypothetical protein
MEQACDVPGRQTALIAYHGWDRVQELVHHGFNAEAEESTVLFAHRTRTARNPPLELMITVLLHKTDDTAWTNEQLAPLKDIRIMDVTPSGSVLGAEITLVDNTKHAVDFTDVDGLRSC